MKGYWFILGTDITDEEAQQKYGKLWAPLAEKYQARLNPTKIPAMLKESRWSTRLIACEGQPGSGWCGWTVDCGLRG